MKKGGSDKVEDLLNIPEWVGVKIDCLLGDMKLGRGASDNPVLHEWVWKMYEVSDWAAIRTINHGYPLFADYNQYIANNQK